MGGHLILLIFVPAYAAVVEFTLWARRAMARETPEPRLRRYLYGAFAIVLLATMPIPAHDAGMILIGVLVFAPLLLPFIALPRGVVAARASSVPRPRE